MVFVTFSKHHGQANLWRFWIPVQWRLWIPGMRNFPQVGALFATLWYWGSQRARCSQVWHMFLLNELKLAKEDQNPQNPRVVWVGHFMSHSMQVLRYLCGASQWGLNYKKICDPDVLQILVDASYAPPHQGYRSVQGMIYMHGSNVLMWNSSRQGFITQSTAESELLAYNEAARVQSP